MYNRFMKFEWDPEKSASNKAKHIDEIRKKIGVDRGALIKVWLHEKVKQEKGAKS